MAKQFLGWYQTSMSNDVQRIGRGLLCAFLLLFASVLQAAPVLQAEINPNPVQPSELLDVQITIGNPTGSTTGQLSLRVLWPEHIGAQPLVTGSGNACGNRYCDPGEYVVWDSTVLGALPAGGNLTVGFTETIWSSVADGTVIPFRIELFEGDVLVRSLSHSVTVQAVSPLELTLDPLPDAVAPGESLTYELTYGNIGNALSTGTILQLPLPAGTSFVSATGGGSHAGGVVSWNLGDLASHGGGRERVTVQVDAGRSNGDPLVVDAAVLSGTVNTQATEARAMAVSQVHGDRPLRLTAEFNPDPV
ncbi:hypothetical protein, partial [Thiolapillus sp.]